MVCVLLLVWFVFFCWRIVFCQVRVLRLLLSERGGERWCVLVVITLPAKCGHRDISLVFPFFLGKEKLFTRQSSWVVSDFLFERASFGVVSTGLGVEKLHDRAILFADWNAVHGCDDPTYLLRWFFWSSYSGWFGSVFFHMYQWKRIKTDDIMPVAWSSRLLVSQPADSTVWSDWRQKSFGDIILPTKTVLLAWFAWQVDRDTPLASSSLADQWQFFVPQYEKILLTCIDFPHRCLDDLDSWGREWEKTHPKDASDVVSLHPKRHAQLRYVLYLRCRLAHNGEIDVYRPCSRYDTRPHQLGDSRLLRYTKNSYHPAWYSYMLGSSHEWRQWCFFLPQNPNWHYSRNVWCFWLLFVHRQKYAPGVRHRFCIRFLSLSHLHQGSSAHGPGSHHQSSVVHSHWQIYHRRGRVVYDIGDSDTVLWSWCFGTFL